jgi:DNA-binding beta-propeller fold protein YncE
VYVALTDGNTVLPIAAGTGRPGRPITVGQQPQVITVTPDGKTAYVANYNEAAGQTVTPINLGTNTAGPAITVGTAPIVMVLTPDGRTPDGRTVCAYSPPSGTVTPIRTATNTALKQVRVPATRQPSAMAVAPGCSHRYRRVLLPSQRLGRSGWAGGLNAFPDAYSARRASGGCAAAGT